jgi:hypothetical protein
VEKDEYIACISYNCNGVFSELPHRSEMEANIHYPVVDCIDIIIERSNAVKNAESGMYLLCILWHTHNLVQLLL